jgi:Fusaric acid resistance protein-like
MACVALPLAIGVAAGHPRYGATASFGGLAGLYVPQSPYRYRARVVAAVGAGLAIAVLIGSMAGSRTWVAAMVTGVVAGVASFVCQAVELPPPRELMLIMVLLAATAVPAGLAGAAQRAGLAALGAALAWLITMSPALGRSRRRLPERRAVDGALAAVAALLDAVGTGQAPAARHTAVESVRRARVTVAQGRVPPGDPLAQAVIAAEALLEAALHIEVEAPGRLRPDWGIAVRALIPAVTGGRVPATPFSGSGIPAEAVPLWQAIEDAHADLACQEPVVTERAALGGWPGIRPQIAAALRRHSVIVPSAARIGIAVGLGVAAGRALGLGHAYWIGLTAAAVLQASNLVITARRVVHRLAGTVIGVGLAFAILGWHPPIWLVVIAVAFFQGLAELAIATNYGVAVASITVLALLLFHVAAPGEALTTTIGSRLLDTAIGAILALLLRRLLWPRATLRRLPSAQASTLRATSRVLTEAWAQHPDPQVLADRRRALQGTLAVLRAVHADATADAGLVSRSTDIAWPVSAGVEELARLALSWPAYRPRPEPAQAARLRHHLEELASAITEARPPDMTIPALPGQPLTEAATAALTSAVADAQRIPASR